MHRPDSDEAREALLRRLDAVVATEGGIKPAADKLELNRGTVERLHRRLPVQRGTYLLLASALVTLDASSLSEKQLAKLSNEAA